MAKAGIGILGLVLAMVMALVAFPEIANVATQGSAESGGLGEFFDKFAGIWIFLAVLIGVAGVVGVLGLIMAGTSKR